MPKNPLQQNFSVTPRPLQPVQAPFARVEQAAPADQSGAGRFVQALSNLSPGIDAVIKRRNAKEAEAGAAFAVAQQINDEAGLQALYNEEQSLAFQDAMAKTAGQAAALRQINAAREAYTRDAQDYASGEKDLNDLFKQTMSLDGIEDTVFRSAALPMLLKGAQQLRAQFAQDAGKWARDKMNADAFLLIADVAQDGKSTPDDLENLFTDMRARGLSPDEIMGLTMQALRKEALGGNVPAFEKYIRHALVNKRGVAAHKDHQGDFYALYERAKSVAAGDKAQKDYVAEWNFRKMIGDQYTAAGLVAPDKLFDDAVAGGIIKPGTASELRKANHDAYKDRVLFETGVMAYRTGADAVAIWQSQDGVDPKKDDRAYNAAALSIITGPDRKLLEGPALQAKIPQLMDLYKTHGRVPTAVSATLRAPQVSSEEALTKQVNLYNALDRAGPTLIKQMDLDPGAEYFYENYSRAKYQSGNHAEALKYAQDMRDKVASEVQRGIWTPTVTKETYEYMLNNLPEPGVLWWERHGSPENQQQAAQFLLQETKRLSRYMLLEDAKSAALEKFNHSIVVVGGAYVDASVFGIDRSEAEGLITIGLHRAAESNGRGPLPAEELTILVDQYAKDTGEFQVMHGTSPIVDRNGKGIRLSIPALRKEYGARKALDWHDKYEREVIEKIERNKATEELYGIGIDHTQDY